MKEQAYIYVGPGNLKTHISAIPDSEKLFLIRTPQLVFFGNKTAMTFKEYIAAYEPDFLMRYRILL